MNFNLPPKLLRVLAGCAVVTLMTMVTFVLMVQRSEGNVLQLGHHNFTVELSPWPELKPGWTTEQLEPKFAYAQYVTSMDYLCNAVSQSAWKKIM